MHAAKVTTSSRSHFERGEILWKQSSHLYASCVPRSCVPHLNMLIVWLSAEPRTLIHAGKNKSMSTGMAKEMEHNDRVKCQLPLRL